MWTTADDVLETDLDDELILMHAAQAEMFSLNASGRLLWRALPASTEALGALLRGTYGLSPEQAAQDVNAWLSDLGGRGLLRST
ncbi:PqqD family protein [Deinococcus taeanensis]|uniref:PqqD family protein n=1 Tax=Deinococcus taeanensis TaxID=2737050 RepID=UPI001CDC122C|nr:PqqD family protein [Deinococcus taeanensis]UBV43187.1 PqqD family protein [Deinococcus taeanensis]